MRPSNRPSNPQSNARRRASIGPMPAHYWRLKPIQWAAVDLGDWLFPWVIMNVLWVLLSLTVVLFPPATAALFETVYQAHRGIAPDPHRYLHNLRRWIIKGWLWAIGNAVVLGGLAWVARSAALAGNEILLAIAGVLVALILLGQFYFWPYMMLQEQPELGRALRNSIFTALGDLLYLALYAAITLAILIPAVITIAPLLLIAPVLLAMLSTYSLIAWLEHHNILQRESRDF